MIAFQPTHPERASWVKREEKECEKEVGKRKRRGSGGGERGSLGGRD